MKIYYHNTDDRPETCIVSTWLLVLAIAIVLGLGIGAVLMAIILTVFA